MSQKRVKKGKHVSSCFKTGQKGSTLVQMDEEKGGGDVGIKNYQQMEDTLQKIALDGTTSTHNTPPTLRPEVYSPLESCCRQRGQ